MPSLRRHIPTWFLGYYTFAISLAPTTCDLTTDSAVLPSLVLRQGPLHISVAFYFFPPCLFFHPLFFMSLGPNLRTPCLVNSTSNQLPHPAEAELPKLTQMDSWAGLTALGASLRGFRTSRGDRSQIVPPSHLLAEEQREGWGCMPAEGAVLSRELRPSGTELPFPVRSGAASQPGQGRARQSSQNKQNKAGERASRTGPEPVALQSRGKATPRAAMDTGPHPTPPPLSERPPSQKPQGDAQTWACGF